MKKIIQKLPVIDIQSLVEGSREVQKTAKEIKEACINYGFFYVINHGVDDALQGQLEGLSARFFSHPLEEKMKIHMALAGKAWRGYFPVGEELTSGKPDLKEGLYFGAELEQADERVKAGLPMHGANLFPDNMPEFRKVVLNYMTALTDLGHRLMYGIALSLGLPGTYFKDHYTTDPLVLFRIFHYPAQTSHPEISAPWGVGEHTDYGVLTILKQDSIGGLQIKTKNGWIDAPYIPNSLVCNIGDMLDRMTRGYYRSTPHRVKNTSGKSRYSYPFFFDPNFDAQIEPIDLAHLELPRDDKSERWDGMSVHEFQGTYGDYILGKVERVFPGFQKNI